MLEYFDVVVIGDGPAGTSSAILCKQAGLSTLIISNRDVRTQSTIKEYQNQPLESLHAGIVPLLEKLNAVKSIENATLSSYEGIQVGSDFQPLSPNQNETWSGFHVSRLSFDENLLNCALRQGVKILSNEQVNQIIKNRGRIVGVKTKSGKKIELKFLVDCSGRNRFIGKLLKLNEVFLSPPLWSWTGKVEKIPKKMFSMLKTSFISIPNGWTWLAPEPPDFCTWSRLSTKRNFEVIPPPQLIDFPMISKIQVVNVRWRIFRPLVKEGVILAGDAAGVLDPAAGQGVLNAVWSGMMAAQAIINSFNNPEIENLQMALYDQWFFDRFENLTQRLKFYYEIHNIHLTEECA